MSHCLPSFTVSPGPPKHQHKPTLSEVMQVYAIPYGGVGFTVHILAYYSISMVAFLSRSPITFQSICYPRFSQAICYMSCIGLIVIGSYHIINIGKVGATWMIVISIWDMSLGILFAAAQAHILTRRSRTPDRGRWLSVPLSEQLNEKLKQWSVFWVYFVICLIGLGLTIFLANKEWDKPKMVCVCGFTVGVTIAILVLLPMWDYVSPLGVCGNGKLGMKEWVLVACIAEMLLSPLFADLVVGIIAEKLMGLPKGQDQGVIGVHIGYIVSSMLPLAMV